MSNQTPDSQALHQALGERIIKLRLQRGWSLQHTAEISGIHEAALSAIERGEATIHLSTLAQIAATLQTSVADLLEGIG